MVTKMMTMLLINCAEVTILTIISTLSPYPWNTDKSSKLNKDDSTPKPSTS